jgi:hypothetical protein
VRDLLRWWLIFLGVVLVAWIGQRVYLRRLFVEWVTTMTELTETVEYELWSRGSKEVEEQKARPRILLAKQKEGYLEVTKPLEAYIAVFVAFSIPAIVMATDWCGNQTNNAIILGTATCDIVAPAFLALRTLATVCVYFSDAGCRAELRDHRKLRRKVWLRARGFGGWCCGAAAGDPDAAGYRVHFSTELETRARSTKARPAAARIVPMVLGTRPGPVSRTRRCDAGMFIAWPPRLGPTIRPTCSCPHNLGQPHLCKHPGGLALRR